MKKYKWIADSNDGSYQDESSVEFSSKKECYNDMRNAVLQKMCWNTDFDADFSDIEDSEYIGYQVRFNRDYIIHESYSGLYTYRIIEIEEDELKTLLLPKKQIEVLIEGLELLQYDKIGNKAEIVTISTLKNYLEANV